MKQIVEMIVAKVNAFFEIGLEEKNKTPSELSMRERALYDAEIDEAIALAKSRH